MPQRQLIDGDLGACQLHCDVALQIAELFERFGFQLDVNTAMEQNLLVFSEVCHELNNVLQITFGFDGIVHVGTARFQLVGAGSILHDLALLK